MINNDIQLNIIMVNKNYLINNEVNELIYCFINWLI